MHKVISLVAAFLFSAATLQAQEFRLGVEGSWTPHYSRTIYTTSDYRNLFSYGARAAWQPLKTFPLEIGVRFLYSYGQMKEYIPEAHPDAPPGTGSTWGTDQHLELYQLEVPLMYRIPLAGDYTLALGIRAGIGRVLAVDRITEYDPQTGAYLGDLAKLIGSGTKFSVSPLAEANVASFRPIVLTLGVGYQFFRPSVVYPDRPGANVDPVDTRNNGDLRGPSVPQKPSSFDIDGMHLTFGIAYAF